MTPERVKQLLEDHKDTTDAHLVSLAADHHLRLATLDMALLTRLSQLEHGWRGLIGSGRQPVPHGNGQHDWLKSLFAPGVGY